MRKYDQGFIGEVWKDGRIIHDNVHVISLTEGPFYAGEEPVSYHKGWEVIINGKLRFFDAVDYSIKRKNTDEKTKK